MMKEPAVEVRSVGPLSYWLA